MNAPFPHPIYVVNLAQDFGGGELYAAFFARALQALGEPVVMVCHVKTSIFNHLAAEGIPLRRVGDDAQLVAALDLPGWVVTHTKIAEATARALKERHWLTGFAHMPLYNRGPGVLALYDRIYAVSEYVLSTLRSHNLAQAHPEPQYGIAETRRHVESHEIHRNPIYAPGGRKLRDRLVSAIERRAIQKIPFRKRPGITLGIVSTIGPIKQFDVLFGYLAPVLSTRREFNIEIFGHGGYKSINQLKHALRPIKRSVRWWGFQPNPSAAFQQIDYLLAGLPEMEALGLNLLEAQAFGVPVLAANAKPFVETVIEGKTGWLYTDPRQDNGASLSTLISDIANGRPHLNPRAHLIHLDRFDNRAFQNRIRSVVADCARDISECQDKRRHYFEH
jgi:glycosyltransferase involved in cell wall biosynthesis